MTVTLLVAAVSPLAGHPPVRPDQQAGEKTHPAAHGHPEAWLHAESQRRTALPCCHGDPACPPPPQPQPCVEASVRP